MFNITLRVWPQYLYIWHYAHKSLIDVDNLWIGKLKILVLLTISGKPNNSSLHVYSPLYVLIILLLKFLYFKSSVYTSNGINSSSIPNKPFWTSCLVFRVMASNLFIIHSVLRLVKLNFFFAVPQTLRHMRGMSDKPGKSKARRKNTAPKGPTKAEIKYKVGGKWNRINYNGISKFLWESKIYGCVLTHPLDDNYLGWC